MQIYLGRCGERAEDAVILVITISLVLSFGATKKILVHNAQLLPAKKAQLYVNVEPVSPVLLQHEICVVVI
jgi:hypothetical protein